MIIGNIGSFHADIQLLHLLKKKKNKLRIKSLILKESITCVQCSTDCIPPLFVSLT